MIIILKIVFILILFNNSIVKTDVIQYIEWDNITLSNLQLDFNMGSTVLFSVSNNTGDHNIIIKESSQNTSEIIKSPVLNFNNNQIYFIYTFIKSGNYLITDDYTNNNLQIMISTNQSSNSSINDSLKNISFSSDDGSQENGDLNNNFFKDSKDILTIQSNDTTTTNSTNKKSILDFFSNYTLSPSNSTHRNYTKKPTTIIVFSHPNENSGVVLNSDQYNSNSNSSLNSNSNSNSIQPPSIYYLIIYLSILFIF
ncbi:hypothetical protein ACTA71_005485 [Dictyostelium dimigraforme]